MRPYLLLLILPVVLSTTACAQYQGPESVEYDPVGDRYFVSNTQSSRIKVRDQSGNVVDFALTPNAPYGLEIMGTVLYACMGNGVRGYDLATGAEVYFRNLGASFPNGITTDGEFLYITDFNTNARRIYKVDPVADTHSTLVTNTGGQPNGIIWDPAGQRLITVFWGSNAPIKAYDRNTGAETVLLANSGLGNNDGITIDCNGNFLVSSWSPQRISRFEHTFIQPAQNLNVSGQGNPADIDFDPVNQVVCIPNSSANTVVLWDISADCLNTGMEEHVPPAMLAWPSPFDAQLHVQATAAGPLQVLDATGRQVHVAQLHVGTTVLDLGALPPGAYLLRWVSQAGNPVLQRVVKG